METRINIDKPSNVDEFKQWLETNLGFTIDTKYEYYFGRVVKILKSDFESTTFWEKVKNQLPEINDKYYEEKKVYLLAPKEIPEIYTKSLDSLLIKAYRKNILNNKNFPEPPDSGWVTPQNWFESINDILRTTISVKYLDGVEYIINELENIANENDLKFDSSFEAREEGYYAAHSGVKCQFSMPDESFSPVDKILNIEIQVTTEIQEIIKTLLHKHYESKRQSITPKDYKWQWDYKCQEFSSNYLGHIIHYVEGMIVEIRDKEE